MAAYSGALIDGLHSVDMPTSSFWCVKLFLVSFRCRTPSRAGSTPITVTHPACRLLGTDLALAWDTSALFPDRDKGGSAVNWVASQRQVG